MRIVVDLDPDTYEKIRGIVEAGRYDSVEQFLRAGADNQLTIEASPEDAAETHSGTQPEHRSPEGTTERPTAPTNAFESVTGHWAHRVPDDIPVREPHTSNRSEVLLFSQFYRFLPLKFALIELANATAELGGPVELEKVRDQVSEAVVPFRNALQDWENAHDISKQDQFSTGFPKRDANNPERAMARYLNHYVGRYRPESEEPAGFGHQLGFISIEPSANEATTVSLSPAGQSFLTLENPVLVDGPDESDNSLSTNEQNYLVAHIRNTLPLEYEFMEFIYDVLEHHDETYTNAMEQFRMFLEGSSGFTDDPTDNRVRSHTAGTISRMVALGVLERGSRRGVYQIAESLDSYRYPPEHSVQMTSNQ